SQHPYTLDVRRMLPAEPVCVARWANDSGARKWPAQGNEEKSRRLVQKRQIPRFATNFGPPGRTAAIHPRMRGGPIGRGQMARRRTKRDAIEFADCRFATLHLSAVTTH